jgi:hypothetical protein
VPSELAVPEQSVPGIHVIVTRSPAVKPSPETVTVVPAIPYP